VSAQEIRSVVEDMTLRPAELGGHRDDVGNYGGRCHRRQVRETGLSGFAVPIQVAEDQIDKAV
jgi:hypothetical protein